MHLFNQFKYQNMQQQMNFKSGVKRVTDRISKGFFEKLGGYCAVAFVTFVASFLGGQCSRQALVEEVKSSFSDVQFPPLDSTYIISNEKSEIAILKAIGFKDRRIILYHVLRFLIVTVFAVILAGAVSIPLTYLAISPIFGMMGMTNMTYTIDPIQIFVIYPLIILGATLLIAFITALYTKTIKSSDTASIE